VLTTDDLVTRRLFFAATGISDGGPAAGVRYRSDGATTETLVMRSKSGTVRTIAAQHSWRKLARYSSIKFD